MGKVHELFANQKRLAHDGIDAEVIQDPMVKFTIERGHFAVPIDIVREVVSSPFISPLPHPVPGFWGIVNIRGHVVPVIDLFVDGKLPGTVVLDRLIIVEIEGRMTFGIKATGVSKVLVPHGSVSPSGVINVQESPVHFLSCEAILDLVAKISAGSVYAS